MTELITPGSKLDSLLAEYVELKPRVDSLTARLKAVTDGIKAECASPNGGTTILHHPALSRPLKLAYVESWRVDAKRMKAEDPETYVRFAVKGGRWELRPVGVWGAVTG